MIFTIILKIFLWFYDRKEFFEEYKRNFFEIQRKNFPESLEKNYLRQNVYYYHNFSRRVARHTILDTKAYLRFF